MAKTITTRKSELCWLYHKRTWGEEEYNDWKLWILGTHTNGDDYWHRKYKFLAELVKDIDWDQAYDIIKGVVESPKALITYTSYSGNTYTETVNLKEELIDAMDDDTWSSGYEIGDAIDTDTERDYNEDNEN